MIVTTMVKCGIVQGVMGLELCGEDIMVLSDAEGRWIRCYCGGCGVAYEPFVVKARLKIIKSREAALADEEFLKTLEKPGCEG